jgi:subtilisin family serine protease
MGHRRIRSNRPHAIFAKAIEALEPRVLFAHNDSFNVTGLTQLRSDPAFSAITGAGVTIAVLDTGVDAANPDLTSKVLAYYNAVETAIPTAITSSSVANAVDNDGHGTHVSGIAASADPTIGVADGASLVDVKVIADSGEKQLSGDPLLRGLDFVQDFASQFNIKVVNMSLGEATSSGGVNLNAVPAADDISREIKTLESMGITIVAASGNSYANMPVAGEGYPAVVSTIGVANTWADNGPGYDFGTYSYGSQFDTWAAVETAAQADQFSATSQRSTLANQVVAPGMNIYSDWNGTSTDNSGSDLLHNTISGTSMASPFVAGLVALMQNAAHVYGGQYITDPNLILEIIKNTSDVIPDNTIAGDGRVPIDNGQLVSNTVSSLPGTGDSYDRVDVYKAIQQIKALFTGATSTADTNNTIGHATVAADLNGTATDNLTGFIGTDGLNNVGAADIDLYQVNLTETGTLTAALSLPGGGKSFVATVRLFDSNGNQIGIVDGTNSAGYPTFTTSSALAANTTYYVGISSQGNDSYNITDGSGAIAGQAGGDYSLTLTLSNPDPNGVPAGAVLVDLTNPDITFPNSNQVGNEFIGTLGSDPAPTGSATRVSVPNGDVDMFNVVAPDTGLLTISVNATSYGQFNGSDSFVEVFREDDSGTIPIFTSIASDGQLSSFASNSQVKVAVTLGVKYIVAVTVDSNSSFAITDPFSRATNSTANQTNYTLDFSFNNGNTDGTALLAQQATVGQTKTGSISSSVSGMGANGGFKYVDWYFFSMPTNGLLNLAATATATGFSPNVQIWTLDSGGGSITEVAGTTGSNSPLIDQVTAGEVIYVSVTGQGNSNFNWFSLGSGSGGQTGSYSLSSQLLPLTDLKALSDGSIDNGTPQTIISGQTIAGNLGQRNGLVVGDTAVDLYKFTPTTTGSYDIRTDTSQEGSADTVLRLFDASGNQIAENDNANGSSTDSFIRASLVAGQTYYIGVSGSGNDAYNLVDGSGTTSGKVGTYVLGLAMSTVPAISVANPAAVEEPAGSSSAAEVDFIVSLDSTSNTAVTVDYTTRNSTATAGLDYTAVSGTLTFAPGVLSQTVEVPVLFNANAVGNETFFLNLSSASSNSVLAGGQAQATITAQPVVTKSLDNKHPVVYTDAAGHQVTLRLAGPGTGTLSLIGDNAASVELVLNNSTATSRLTVSEAGSGTTLFSELQINGSLASLIAPHVDLEGDLTVTGTIKTLELAKIGGGHTLSIAGTGVGAAITLQNVSDLTVSTTEPIISLVSAGLVNANGTDSITAPSIKTLRIKGDFATSLNLTAGGVSLGSATIGGNITGGTWTIAGSSGAITTKSIASPWEATFAGDISTLNVAGDAAGSLTANSIRMLKVKQDLTDATITLTGGDSKTPSLRNIQIGGTLSDSKILADDDIDAARLGAIAGSDVFAGVSSTVTTLPTSAADFTAAAEILSFIVTGIPNSTFAVTNSNIAAEKLGKVSVRGVDTTNGAIPFGFAAVSLASFQNMAAPLAIVHWTPTKPTSDLIFPGDFQVKLL